jgi:enoyl-CoA hydratase
MIDAQRAYEIGLANGVCAASELEKTVESIANRIMENAPQAQTQLIGAVNAGFETQTDGFMAEAEAFGACFDTENFVEGTQSFLRKRKPRY